MEKRKLMQLFGVVLIGTMLFTGCASGQADGTEESAATPTPTQAAAVTTEDDKAGTAASTASATSATMPETPPEGTPGNPPEGNPPEGTPGNPPEGNPPEGMPGNPPEGNPPEGMPGGNPPEGMPGGAGGQAPEEYAAATEYTTDTETEGQTYLSEGTDENAVLVSEGAKVTLKQAVVERNSADSTGGDASSFYGIGAAALVTDGTLTVENSEISTDAAGAAGVFAYGSGTVVVSDTTIVTKQNTSGGIHVAGGGTLYANNLTVETNGASSAAIRSDRGGGTMEVDGGTYTSHGTGSPAVYCTADILISNAVLAATNSEAVCIEGLNSLTLNDCELSGNIPENEQNDCDWTVILYQSMSGDSEIGNSSFTMNGGTLTSYYGGLFYTTNTESTFSLTNVKLVPSENNDFLLKCTGNANQRGWGTTGANGADCTFTASMQQMEGRVIWDSISTLEFSLTNQSVLTGSFVQDESCAGAGGNGYANVTVDATSKWIVTGDSVITSLTCAGTICDADGNSVTVLGTDGTCYVSGTSAYTVTVTAFTAAK